jgi:hypothetical protein
MAHPDRITISQLTRELTAYTGARSPIYRPVYKLILNGRVPAGQEGDCWLVRRTGLPAIAATAGLTIPADHAAA